LKLNNYARYGIPAVVVLAVAGSMIAAVVNPHVISQNKNGTNTVTINTGHIKLTDSPAINEAFTFTKDDTLTGWDKSPVAAPNSEYTLAQKNGACVVTATLGYVSADQAGIGDYEASKNTFQLNFFDSTAKEPTTAGIVTFKTSTGGTIDFMSATYPTRGGFRSSMLRTVDKLFPNGLRPDQIPKTTVKTNIDWTKGLPTLTLTVNCPTEADLKKANPDEIAKHFTVNLKG
jgi:hypothetical protein